MAESNTKYWTRVLITSALILLLLLLYCGRTIYVFGGLLLSDTVSVSDHNFFLLVLYSCGNFPAL